MIDDLAKQVAVLNNSIVATRRELHQHPELAFEEIVDGGVRGVPDGERWRGG